MVYLRPCNECPGIPLVEDLVRLVGRRDAAVVQGLVEILALELVVREETVGDELEGVGAFLRDDVHDRAVGVRFGRHTAGLHDHFFDDGRVDLVARVAGAVLDAHAVEVLLRAALAVIGTRLREVAATDVGDAREAGGQGDEGVDTLRGGGQRVDDVAGRGGLLADVLRVDERRRAADRDGLLQGADGHVGVDRHGDARGQGDPFALDDVEAGQREGHRVGAVREVDEVESSFAVAGR